MSLGECGTLKLRGQVKKSFTEYDYRRMDIDEMRWGEGTGCLPLIHDCEDAQREKFVCLVSNG